MKIRQLIESSSRSTTMPPYQKVRFEGIKFIRDSLAGSEPSYEKILTLVNKYLSLPRNEFLTDKLKDSLKHDMLDAFLS